MTHVTFYERYNALREGHCIAAKDAYFDARPPLDNFSHRSIFEKGFNRGYDRGYDAAAQPAVRNLTHDEWDAWKDKWQVMLKREAWDDLCAIFATPPTRTQRVFLRLRVCPNQIVCTHVKTCV
jgi:hypothetical protein